MWSHQQEKTKKLNYKGYELPLDSLYCPPISPSGILRASMCEFGILQPLVVTPAREGYVVLDGRQRYHVAREMGLKYVPVVSIELSQAHKAELARWNPGLLVPGKVEQERVAGIIEEAKKREVIKEQDVPELEYLNEEQLVAALQKFIQKKVPTPQKQ